MADLPALIDSISRSVSGVATENYDAVYGWAKGSIFFYQLLLSLAAAYIFWVVFNWLPYLRRRKKLRPVFELDLLQLRSKLFVMFDCVMSQGPIMTTGFYQRKIYGGKLSSYDIRVGLQNKCLNSHYFYDPVTAPMLVPVGQQLSDDADEAFKLIEKALKLSHFASSEEILLLEKIAQELKRFDFKNDLLSNSPTNQYFRPAITALTHLEQPLMNLYSSFMALQKVIYGGPALLDQQASVTQVLYLFNSENYGKCLQIINKYLSFKTPGDPKFLHRTFKIMCLNRMGRKRELYSVLDAFLATRPYGEHLASMRGLLLELSDDARAMAVFRKYFSQEAIDKTVGVLSNEKLVVDRFIEQAKFLSRHFSSLDNRLEPL